MTLKKLLWKQQSFCHTWKKEKMGKNEADNMSYIQLESIFIAEKYPMQINALIK